MNKLHVSFICGPFDCQIQIYFIILNFSFLSFSLRGRTHGMFLFAIVKYLLWHWTFFTVQYKKILAAVGFEPTPPRRLVPLTSALDRSATLPCYIYVIIYLFNPILSLNKFLCSKVQKNVTSLASSFLNIISFLSSEFCNPVRQGVTWSNQNFLII